MNVLKLWIWKSLVVPYTHFSRCRVGLSATKGGTVEAKVATYLHPVGLQRPSRGGLAQRKHAYYSHPVVLGWKSTLCLWKRQRGGIRLAVGCQNQ